MPASHRSENRDARTASIVRSAGLVRLLNGVLTVAVAAWRDSIAVTVVRRTFDRVSGPTADGRTRVAGGVTVVASITTLAMQRLAPRPAPLTWIVPMLFLVAGVCLLVAARERPAR